MKRICLTLLAILALAVPSIQAGAQSWPTRPIRAIVPYTAGSGTDVTARVILNQLSSELGQSIIVENRVGAGGTIGTAAAAKAETDGYTILVQSSALPDAPTTAEAGFTDAESPIWWATFVPAKTSRDIVDKLYRETMKAMQAPNVQERLTTMGVDPLVLTPAELDAHIKNELSMNAALVKAIGVKAN